MATNVRPAPLGDVDPNDKLFGMLAYIIGLLVPAFILLSDTNKNRPFQKYHAVNSLLFSAAWIALFIVLTIVSFIPFVGFITICISFLLPLAILGVAIWYAVLAYQGNYFEIPFLTDLARQQGWLPPTTGTYS